MKIAEAHERATGAMLSGIDAHAAVFGGDETTAEAKIREAIGCHRDAINLLVAALPDVLEAERIRRAGMAGAVGQEGS